MLSALKIRTTLEDNIMISIYLFLKGRSVERNC